MFDSKSLSFLLNSGAKIPAIGFGTGTKWYKSGNSTIDSQLVVTLNTAVEKGYKHIDAAQAYNTDPEIGQFFSTSNVKRSDIWLTDKYMPSDGKDNAKFEDINPYERLKISLRSLGVDYVDLYLIHSPFVKKETHGYTLEDVWKSMERCVSEGLAKNIGVSNFSVEDLKAILQVAKIKPAVNQIEFNAYLQNQTPGIVEFSQKENILLEAYSPLGPIIKGKPGPIDAVLKQLSTKYGKKDTQILLRWVIQRGVLPVTTSSKPSRISETLDIFDFELTSEEVQSITDLGAKKTFRQFWTAQYSQYD